MRIAKQSTTHYSTKNKDAEEECYNTLELPPPIPLLLPKSGPLSSFDVPFIVSSSNKVERLSAPSSTVSHFDFFEHNYYLIFFRHLVSLLPWQRATRIPSLLQIRRRVLDHAHTSRPLPRAMAVCSDSVLPVQSRRAGILGQH